MYSRPPRIFLVAGEPSGDMLGGGLVREILAACTDASIFGVGGPQMAAAGMKLLFPYDDLAVMGLVEVLPRYFRIRRRWHTVMQAIEKFDPDVVITIDSSGFNKPIARKLRSMGHPARRVHYVAPMVWAWRPGRAKKMAPLFHHLMVLFPFEPAYFTEHGLPTTFVGHPATEAVRGDSLSFRTRHGISPTAKVMLMLPGSRRGEVQKLLPVFADAARRIKTELPEVEIVVPTLPLVSGLVRSLLDSASLPAIVVESEAEKRDAFAAAHTALASSGTVTLELALAGVPMVVAYRMNRVTAAIGKRLLNVNSASLPNILSEAPFIPEFLQDQCEPAGIAAEMCRLLGDPDAHSEQQSKLQAIRESLSTPCASPSSAAAAIVLQEAATRLSASNPTKRA